MHSWEHELPGCPRPGVNEPGASARSGYCFFAEHRPHPPSSSGEAEPTAAPKMQDEWVTGRGASPAVIAKGKRHVDLGAREAHAVLGDSCSSLCSSDTFPHLAAKKHRTPLVGEPQSPARHVPIS